MIIGGVAKRYARALFEIGVEEGTYRKILEELEDFCSFLRENEDVKKVLTTSVYNTREKRAVLDAILEKKGYSDVVTRFLTLILEKGRMVFIEQILKGFTLLVEQHEGIERVEVTVPAPLDEAQKGELARVLEEIRQRKVVIEEKVDPSIIGGLVIRVGSIVYDGSVKTQIHKLSENLKKG
ncbi:MAG: F0F1 ATP synthase subunit delta [Deltaproteobacteria bacterium]|nr:MAG: F0F1 ATP synthase subunit delta [Deltaproteobacteria bacterium]